MAKITWADLTPSPSNPHRFVAEASQLRLAVGHFPNTIAADAGIGNGLPFVRRARREDGGYDYEQMLGCIVVRIFND